MKKIILKTVTLEDDLNGKDVAFVTFYGDFWNAKVIRQYVDPSIQKIRIIVKKNNDEEYSACNLEDAIDNNRVFLFEFIDDPSCSDCSTCSERASCVLLEPVVNLFKYKEALK